MAPKQTEAALHRTVARYLDLMLARSVVWSTVPSGGGGKIRGAKLKAAGLKRGLGDLYLSWQSYDCETSTLWLELKSAVGRQSAEQKSFQRRVEYIGHHYRIVRSLDDVIAVLAEFDVPTRARAA